MGDQFISLPNDLRVSRFSKTDQCSPNPLLMSRSILLQRARTEGEAHRLWSALLRFEQELRGLASEFRAASEADRLRAAQPVLNILYYMPGSANGRAVKAELYRTAGYAEGEARKIEKLLDRWNHDEIVLKEFRLLGRMRIRNRRIGLASKSTEALEGAMSDAGVRTQVIKDTSGIVNKYLLTLYLKKRYPKWSPATCKALANFTIENYLDYATAIGHAIDANMLSLSGSKGDKLLTARLDDIADAFLLAVVANGLKSAPIDSKVGKVLVSSLAASIDNVSSQLNSISSSTSGRKRVVVDRTVRDALGAGLAEALSFETTGGPADAAMVVWVNTFVGPLSGALTNVLCDVLDKKIGPEEALPKLVEILLRVDLPGLIVKASAAGIVPIIQESVSTALHVPEVEQDWVVQRKATIDVDSRNVQRRRRNRSAAKSKQRNRRQK